MVLQTHNRFESEGRVQSAVDRASKITQILGGPPEQLAEELLPVVYAELRAIARRRMAAAKVAVRIPFQRRDFSNLQTMYGGE